MRCLACDAENEAGSKFCMACGTPLTALDGPGADDAEAAPAAEPEQAGTEVDRIRGTTPTTR